MATFEGLGGFLGVGRRGRGALALPSGAKSLGTKPGLGVARLNHCTMPSTPRKFASEAVLGEKSAAGRSVAGPRVCLDCDPASQAERVGSGFGVGVKLGVFGGLLAKFGVAGVSRPASKAFMEWWELGTGLRDLVRAGIPPLIEALAGVCCGNHWSRTGCSSASKFDVLSGAIGGDSATGGVCSSGRDPNGELCAIGGGLFVGYDRIGEPPGLPA